MAELKKTAIVGSARIPFCRAYTGYAGESNLSMLSAALGGLADRFNLRTQSVDEVVGGAVISHSRDFNLAREAALDAGLPPRTTGTNLQIACGTSLQAALMLGGKIASGEIDSGIACGTDTVSDSPIVFGTKFQHRLVELNRAEGAYLSAQLKPKAERTAAELHRDVGAVVNAHIGRSDQVGAMVAAHGLDVHVNAPV